MRGTYITNSQIYNYNVQVKSFWYGDAYALVNGTIKGAEADAAARQADERNEQVIFKKLCTFHRLHKQN